ncbi:exodeoxyribonuclease VII small subunit [Candidatus Shapirobacteria bacterium CG09_land_8_20_14_0_10_49_15]|uniref:Exodeoxyribonuclease 7 small subunit n=1 Tax=Candidatus Shapirobacteria bacterium CG09_land_8_20_14_0_10_49_15 TaxID=1974482 RepID=A0A2M6XB97_9BACT|nr:MAG: exodeoxyribonuclease VII small subunit [Candidatus Shapirobacteria bacterium CG09_land_8_20_14_0_10_49_15]
MTDRKSSLAKMFAELEAITAEFETGQIDLEAGLPKFKRGLQLAKILKKRLAQLENEIEEIKTEEVKIPKVHT